MFQGADGPIEKITEQLMHSREGEEDGVFSCPAVVEKDIPSPFESAILEGRATSWLMSAALWQYRMRYSHLESINAGALGM